MRVKRTVFIAASLDTLGSVKTPIWTWRNESEDYSAGSRMNHLACFHILEVHTHFRRHAIAKSQVGRCNLSFGGH